LRQAEAGTPVVDLCRKMEITETTFYRWKKKCYGLGVSELRELAERSSNSARRCLALEAAPRFRGAEVAAMLSSVIAERGKAPGGSVRSRHGIHVARARSMGMLE
jgi:hypothetical protein